MAPHWSVYIGSQGCKKKKKMILLDWSPTTIVNFKIYCKTLKLIENKTGHEQQI